MKTVLKILGYSLFGLIMLVVSLYLTLPTASLRERLTHEAFKRGYKLEMKTLELDWVTGIVASGVALTFPQEKGAIEPPAKLQLDHVEARLAIVPLLSGAKRIDFVARQGEGRIAGRISESDTGRALSAHLERVDLQDFPVLASVLATPLSGAIAVDLDVTLVEDRPDSGSVKLTLSQVKAGPRQISTAMGPTSMPEIDLGTIVVAGEMQEGRFDIGTFEQKSAELEATASGSMSMRERLVTTTMDLELRFKFNDAFFEAHPEKKALPQLMKGALEDDGRYAYQIGGTFQRPRFDRPRKGGPADRTRKGPRTGKGEVLPVGRGR